MEDIHTMQIGDVVKKVPITFRSIHHDLGGYKPMEGRVVYLHPAGRYYVLEFDFGFGRKARESFLTY